MLFRVKRSLPATLLTASLLAAVSLVVGLRGPLPPPRPGPALFSLVVLGLSDAALHALLWRLGGQSYRRRWRRLAEFFAGQGPAEILAGGWLAAIEELFFRGVLLVGLLRYGCPPAVAVPVVALLFAGCHDLPGELRLFTVWAVWEGCLLGALLLLTGSLPAVMLAHAVHDVAGFALFAVVRRGQEPRPAGRSPRREAR